ncbi:MAG: signal peptide peptidase SppA [Clostridia bacterium]|nr:signal peptide peptidase SppA [Clostridia bacterium]
MPLHWTRVLVIGLAVIALAATAVAWLAPGSAAGRMAAAPAVAIVYVEGTLGGGGMTGAGVSATDVMDQLRRARESGAVRAVVLRLDTPGGSAAAAQEIAAEVERLRASGKPVVVSMGDVAASGGYWIAAVADRIVASPATVTGSIGVIMDVPNLRALLERLGVAVDTVKSGPHKDIGSPLRSLSEEERRILQGMVNDIYEQFVDAVARGRRLPRERVYALADGRVFTGRQAQENGLVDQLGNLPDAVEAAAELAGLAPGYRVEEMGRETPWWRLLRDLGLGAGPWRGLWPLPRAEGFLR